LLGRQLRQEQRHLHVALGGEDRQQVVELEDEADVARAPLGEAPGREPVEPLAHDDDLPLVRAIETADQVQQRRLPRAGRAHQRENSPSSTSRSRPCSTSTRCLPREYPFRTLRIDTIAAMPLTPR